MNRSSDLPLRQIHLDFHTSPHIPDVGSEFDPKAFAQAMVDARVNSVTVFAKCHHGQLYYTTGHPARHPGLSPDLNLLKLQVDALHDRGIRAPIYLSVQCDEYAANQHPGWIARNPDGTPVGGRPLMTPYPPFSWQILDMSTPYQDYLADQLAEVLRLFHPVDGIFFDMCWDQPSTNSHFLRAMRSADLNPELPGDRVAYARKLSQQYMRRFHDQVKAANPNAGVYFNSRPIDRLSEDAAFQTQFEIEALPSGGWGYMFFPKNVRYARRLGKPYLGMTARFHKSWADFGGFKPYAALEYETSQMIAHGAGCSIGDQLHPRGTLDPVSYELIGKVYRRIEALEPYVTQSEAVVDIGLFHAGNGDAITSLSDTDIGATRMLMQLKHQFDVIDCHSDLDRFKLVILPDSVRITPELAERLAGFVDRGGSLLASGTCGLAIEGDVALPQLGITHAERSTFANSYFRPRPSIGKQLPVSDHIIYDRVLNIATSPSTEVLADLVNPYFDRAWDHFSSHAQTPPDRLSGHPAATLNGRSAYVAFPIFQSFAVNGSPVYRGLISSLIDRLLDAPCVRTNAPTGTEISVMRQPDRTIVHLLHYSPERRAAQFDIVEDIVPLHDLQLSVRCDRTPSRVFLAPENTPLPFRIAEGRVNLTLPRLNGHAVIVLAD